MSLREIYQNITSQIWNEINTDFITLQEYEVFSTDTERSRYIMFKILDYINQTLKTDIPITQYKNIGKLDKKQNKALKVLFFSLQNKTKFYPKINDTILTNNFKKYDILENVIKDVILNVIKNNEIEVPNVEDINKYVNLDDAIDEQEGRSKFIDRTGPQDLFTNSELIQDNITQLNMYIDKINKKLYKGLKSITTEEYEKKVLKQEEKENIIKESGGEITPEEEILFNPENYFLIDPNSIIPGIRNVENLFNRLLQLAGGDKKLISDKYDQVVYYLSKPTSNLANDLDTYFKLGIFPLKKVNVKDQNKPSKNANLITGTQNIYKIENTQNPFKISPYVNNDLGDYVVNGKKINIKLVGLNYIVKEGSKTKLFKNLSHAKQFIYNGGFDTYNNNKSKFINNVSKDFNNKKQPLRLSYSSNIF